MIFIYPCWLIKNQKPDKRRSYPMFSVLYFVAVFKFKALYL